MKVYIAGSSDKNEIGAVRAMQDIVRTHGHEVISQWIDCEGLQRPSSRSERRIFARGDTEGVMTCDVFWLLVPAVKSEGAFFEFGIAWKMKKRTIVSGPTALREDRLFCELAAEIHLTHEAALAALLGRSLGPTTIGER